MPAVRPDAPVWYDELAYISFPRFWNSAAEEQIMFTILGELEWASMAQMVTAFVVGATCLSNYFAGPRFGG